MRSFLKSACVAAILSACSSASLPSNVPVVAMNVPFPGDPDPDRVAVSVPVADAAMKTMNATPLIEREEDEDPYPLPPLIPRLDPPRLDEDPASVHGEFDLYLLYPNQLIIFCMYCFPGETSCSQNLELKREEAHMRGVDPWSIQVLCYTVPLPPPCTARCMTPPRRPP
jgi:hypothetical protein